MRTLKSCGNASDALLRDAKDFLTSEPPSLGETLGGRTAFFTPSPLI